MNFLREILADTRRVVAARKKRMPLEALRERPLFGRAPFSLRRTLEMRSPAVIAEIKKASPSRGLIAKEFDPAGIARAYAWGGAAAISVLTEERHFLGSIADLESARLAVDIPILRKDFIVDPYQVAESKAAGADAILLIAAALPQAGLGELQGAARELGLECLVEVHSAGELERVRDLRPALIGINNRDLTTFRTDIALSARLARLVPADTLCVSESGIRSHRDIATLGRAGIGAFLVGEHLMRSGDPEMSLRALLGKEAA
ncbi:MAG TPA: indole-3-glycerol phosphate synthase TrpC [Bacteroidota bacterium]|nr:indole-3-glycerol phosphate synthase TrpC [Bacteroidota bacterium]